MARPRLPRETRTCEWCKKPYEAKVHDLRNKRFCSKPCHMAWWGTKPISEFETRKCDNCGKEFTRRVTKQNKNAAHALCSRKCSADWTHKHLLIDLTGKLFGSLVVKKRVYPHKERTNGDAWWECLCACGRTKQVKSSSLRYGYTRSCGSQFCNSDQMHNRMVDPRTTDQRAEVSRRHHRVNKVMNDIFKKGKP